MRGLTNILFDINDFVIQFVDYLAVISSDFEKHIDHLKILLERALENNFRINFGKSDFAQKKIKFLGHYLSQDGLTPYPQKKSLLLKHSSTNERMRTTGFSRIHKLLHQIC